MKNWFFLQFIVVDKAEDESKKSQNLVKKRKEKVPTEQYTGKSSK